MKVLMLGPTGMIGSRLAEELGRRGHVVTPGIRVGTANPLPGAVAVDPREAGSIAQAAGGHDAIVSALGGAASGDARLVAEVAPALLVGAEMANVRRVLVVGGAGSLTEADGTRLIDAPGFPEAWRPGSQAQVDALSIFREHQGPVNWSYLSPSDEIEPGHRSGDIVLGDDHVLRDENGRSFVSAEDYSVALVDELEQPQHVRRRFTVRSR